MISNFERDGPPYRYTTDFYIIIIIQTRVFYWELNHSQIPYATSSGTRVAYFPYVTFVSVVSFNDVELVSPYNKKNKHYTLAQRYEFYVLVARTISHEFASLTREILLLPLEHKIHIFSPPCNILYKLKETSLTNYYCLY